MISRIRGKVDQYSDNTLVLNTGGVSYEVFIPTAVGKSMNGAFTKDAAIELVTYHYYQTDPSKSIPILIGFANSIEKDFFEKFITVSGVGPKAAVKALSMPIPEIAQAIDAGDVPYLKSLPGIGEQRAKEIVAKLQGKMGKFSLMQSLGNGTAHKSDAKGQVEAEALEVLLQLEYKRDEAREMIRKAFARKSNLSSSEEVLNEVYRQKQGKE